MYHVDFRVVSSNRNRLFYLQLYIKSYPPFTYLIIATTICGAILIAEHKTLFESDNKGLGIDNLQLISSMTTIGTQLPRMQVELRGRSLRVGEFVPTAAKLARHITIEELEDTHKLERYYTAQREMRTTLGSALPLETELKTDLSFRLNILDREIALLEHTPEFDLPTLDPSFLSWKTRSGYPGFSIFRLDNDMTTIRFNYGSQAVAKIMDLVTATRRQNSGDALQEISDIVHVRTRNVTRFDLTMEPSIPGIMAECYLDEQLNKTFSTRCYHQQLQSMTITTQYRGAMPCKVRDKIHAWQSVPVGQPRFDDIFIVSEAPEEAWKVSEISAYLDPLVIGVAYGHLWLIDTYDLTSVEKLAWDICSNASKINN